MDRPKVSVIIPVYKAERYIERCVRSLFEQTLDDIEYIFVDDCSPDKSISIMHKVLEEYPHRKKNVKIVSHSVNKGVGQTRQDGIDCASGKYLIHCDPDDWVDISIYQKLYSEAVRVSADMVICDFFYTLPNFIISKQEPECLDGINLLEQITGVNPNPLHGSLWNKLIRREILANAKIPVEYSFCEDVDYLTQILNSVKNVAYIPEPLYFYEYKADGNSLCSVKNLEGIVNDENHIIDLLGRASSSIRHQVCLQSFALKIIACRVLFCDLVDDGYFKKHFSKYRIYLRNYHSTDKIYLMIAMYISLSFSRTIRMFLHSTKTKIRKIFRFLNII